MFSVKVPQKLDDDKPFAIFAVDNMKEALTSLLSVGASLIGEQFDLPLHERGYNEYKTSLLGAGVPLDAFTNSLPE
jgi:hypothetical protein